MSIFTDLFGPMTEGATAFPFGVPDQGAPAWGNPPVPSTPGQLATAAPGALPTVAQGGMGPDLPPTALSPQPPPGGGTLPTMAQGGMGPDVPATGGGFMDKIKALVNDKGFMGEAGAAAGKAGGGAKPDMSISGGGGGDPSAASRQGAGALLSSILESRQPQKIGPVPAMPPGLMELFAGGRR